MAPVRSRDAGTLLAALALLALLVSPIALAGLEEPFEVDAADAARRIAVSTLGAQGLAEPTDPPAPPTLGDLGMGELPFVSIALAFRLLGPAPWVGRLPMALFAVAGVVATAALLWRFAGRGPALLAAAILATCPLLALQARAMLGEAAPLGAFALASAGLAGALLEPRRAARVAWGSVAVLGLAGGFASRGLWLGVASPLLAASLATRASLAGLPLEAQRRARWAAPALGGAAVLAGGWFCLRAAPLWGVADPSVLRVVGVALSGAPGAEGRFDRVLGAVGHGAFPFCALLPIAIARAIQGPSALDRTCPPERRPALAALRAHLLAGFGVSLVASSALAPAAPSLPWLGVAPMAGLLALALVDPSRRARSPAAGVVTALSAVVLAVDLARDPSRSLVATLREGASMPAALQGRASLAFLACGAVVGLAALLASGPEPPVRGRALVRGLPRDVVAWVRAITEAWDGWLSFALVVVQAALVGLSLMVLVGGALDWGTLRAFSGSTRRMLLHAAWVLPVALVLGPIAARLLRGLFLSAAHRLRLPAPTLAALCVVVAASAISVGLHPAAAALSSPAEAFAAYRALAAPGDGIGLVGVRPEIAPFHGGRRVERLPTLPIAARWLTDAPATGPRRFLVLPAEDLGELNALFRTRAGRNVPVADARGRHVLAASRAGTEPDRSPLADVVLDTPRPPARPVSARLEDVVEVLGWEVVDGEGAVVSAVSPGAPYEARFHIRVLGPVPATHRPFLHVDRGKLRWNGDEHFVDRGYPSSLWRTGDVIVLTCALRLESNFLPGDYDVHFGLFSGAARLEVTEGPESADRVRMGLLRVE